jgi:hypothetical protein
MTKYSFEISNGGTFLDALELRDDAAAFRQALHTIRDAESSLSAEGGEWSLVLTRDDQPIYRIDVRVQKIIGPGE